MMIIIRLLVIVLFFGFHISSSALTIEQYKNQYGLLPCTGLETRIISFDKKITMRLSNASKKEKSDLKREYKALNILYKQKKCHKRTSR
ncbi:hypothetical protein AYY19_03645 [Photobacterium aquimaris]|uniref:Uncharacterized protein n=1 Tax=Photobacterium aquimaris TaxID=512643 RepID=A0A2T3INS3_9GAMM|nr:MULTISPECIES: hypothetical protein [Photobacterium]OBU16267.1 hypothetical protein AYY19_03645 [Photobacterium aquimaris]OBU22271.1 hypothetical protein AYY20_12070 [Photobacterium aquimaris]PSU30000.1 hypothetical protein CTM88_05865 [Photobacterium aquimaris]PSW02330.1 hypothetical protein CTM91_04430 [Photobacterium aquimaris]